MPPRRSRAAKKAEEEQVATESTQPAEPSTPPAAATAAAAVETVSEEATDPTPSSSTASKAKGKSRAARHQPLVLEQPPPEEDAPSAAEPESAEQAEPSSSSLSKATMEDRQARLSALRAKMAASTRANRKDILSEQSRSRAIASELKNPSASRKLQKAEKVLEERDLREAGEDVERHRNMAYSLEDSERWDVKLEEKERRKDQGVADFGDAAERAYQRQIRGLKPNVAGYKKMRDEAEGLKASSPASHALVAAGKGKGRAMQRFNGHEAGADVFHYGSHKPSDDAVDRVVSHLNQEKQLIKNRSRRRQEDPDAEVNYINDGNKHFNKKLKRFYDKQTQEIRENLERGTAL